MKVFVAARFGQKEKVRALYEELEKRGYKITLDWTKHKPIKPYIDNQELSAKYSNEDIMGVFDCDIFILLADEAGTGMHIEFGAALITNITCVGQPKIYVVGEHNARSMFYFHPSVKRVESAEELLKEIDELNRRTNKERRPGMECEEKEREYLEKIFKKLEQVTEKFTKEESVGLSAKSVKINRVVNPPKGFRGFTSNPTDFLRNKLKEKYPNARGLIIFYLMENVIGYKI